MNSVDQDLISLQVEKEITNLFKYYLEILENLKLEPEKQSTIRKLILDHGNDSIRNIFQFINYFDFQINKEKVEEAAKKRISKRFTTNSVLSLE